VQYRNTGREMSKNLCLIAKRRNKSCHLCQQVENKYHQHMQEATDRFYTSLTIMSTYEMDFSRYKGSYIPITTGKSIPSSLSKRA